MSLDFSQDNLNFDNVEIEELTKAPKESLRYRYYNEVEPPRLQEETTSEEKDEVENVLSTQVGGKAGSLLYTGADAAGFHLDAGKSYIYPTNYPVRQYQAAMVKTALFKNTMVSLPTGLGKTFIAAVVMYNFYRWYPNGKVVFMAPTRPLVAQQTKACHHIMNIPVEHTAELTGMQNAELRVNLWKEKRVFYLTPQVMVNDLKSKTCPASLIKCIVIDEAHRATKDYAYCQVLKLLSEENQAIFRVLGLSATPGNDINAVKQVVKNLGISALEMRSEDSLDVAPYTHSRSVDTMVVELSSNIIRVKDDLLQVYEKYAKRLKDIKALSNNIAMVSKFQILKACEKFRTNPPRGMPPAVIGNFISDFTVCMSLAHSLELLQTYGLRAFYTYLADENSEKTKAAATRLKKDEDLREMLKRLHGCIFPQPGKGSSYTWSHPKLKNLITVLTEHFQRYQSEGGSTKAIVFCQYRVVVSEIVELLSKFKPLVKATEFIGQSGGKEKGMPQAKQLQIMKDFRNGIVNVLVATCVAEEGLDIGEVDLIIMMESHKSPVRLVQRIGRTGRKRKGACIVLLTKGREEQKFHEAMATRKSYVENIMKSAAVKASLCHFSPRMIPIEFNPIQQLVHINVTNLESPARPQIKKQSDIRKCFTAANSPLLSDDELSKVLEELGGHPLRFNTLPKNEEIWHRRFDKKVSIDELLSKSQTKLAEWNEWNHEEHETYYINHTSYSKLLCRVLKLSSKEIDGLNFEELLKAGVSCSKTDDAVGNLEEKHSSPNIKKKLKKDTVKKNLGMDIRQCLAFAGEKCPAPPQKKMTELVSDEEINGKVSLAPPINTEICQITDSRRDIICEFSISGSYPFNLLNKFIPTISNAPKAWACERTLPKLDIFFKTMTIDIIKNLKFSETSPETTDKLNIIKNPEKLITSNDFVEIDDLFDTESDKDDNAVNRNLLNTAIFEFHDHDFDLDDLSNKKKTQKHTKSNLDTSYDRNNSRLLNSSNVTNISFNANNDIALRVSSPLYLNTSQPNSLEKPIWSGLTTKNQSKSELITITSLMNRPYYLSPTNKCAVSKENLNCMVSSTPIPSVKKFQKSQIISKDSSQSLKVSNKIISGDKSPCSDTSDMWNLSDLFEEEEIKHGLEGKNKRFSDLKAESDVDNDVLNEDISCHHVNDLQNSTMLGVTQMVSLIEKEKIYLNNVCTSQIVKKNNDDSFTNTKTCDEQIKNNLSHYLDSDVEIFNEVNDVLVVPKHSQGSFNNSENIKQSHYEIQSSESKMSLNSKELVISKPSQSLFNDSKETLSFFNDSKETNWIQSKFEKCSPLSSKCKTSLNSKQWEMLKHSEGLVNDSEKSKGSYSKIKEFPSLSSESKISFNSKHLLMTKPSRVLVNDSENASSECKTFSNAKEIELSNSMDDYVNNINMQNSQKHCAVKNFKKFTAKKALLLSYGKSSQNVSSTNKKNEFPPVSGKTEIFANDLWKPFFTDTTNDSTKPQVSNNVSMFDEFKSQKNHTTSPECSKRVIKSLSLINGKKFDSISSADQKRSKKSVENKQLNHVNTPVSSKIIFQENKNELQPCSFKKPIWNFSDSDDSDVFEVPSLKNKISLSEEKEEFLKIRKQKHKHKKKSNEFIDHEAEVSGTIFSSDDTDGSSLDDIDNSFINDNTELISNDTQAIYLKSIKSPLNKGTFKIPAKPKYFGEVYSQQVEQDSEYVNDSFCVDSEEEDEDQSTNSLSFLEIAERKLAKSKSKIPPKKKRRRILNASPENSSPENTNLTMIQQSPKNMIKKRKRRLIQSESEAEESPRRKKHLILPEVEIDSDLYKHSTFKKKENGKICNVLFTNSSDEENPDGKEEKIIDLTLSSNEDENSESELERKFQEDLKKAIIKSQSDFIRSQSSQGALSESLQTSTPKTKRKVLDLDKLDRSVRYLNQKFSKRLSEIRSEFCSSDKD